MASKNSRTGDHTPVQPIPSIDGHPLPVSRKRAGTPWRRSHVIMLVTAAIAMTVIERTIVQAVTR